MQFNAAVVAVASTTTKFATLIILFLINKIFLIKSSEI